MKSNDKKENNNIKNEKNNKFIMVVAISAFILLIIFFIMFSETVVSGKIIINNKTESDIENVRIYFDNANSEYYSSVFLTDDLISTEVNSGSTKEGSYDKIDMFSLDAQLCVNVTLNGEEIEFYAGEFNESFKGKIKITIYEEDGTKYITIYSETGVFSLFSKVKSNVTYVLE